MSFRVCLGVLLFVLVAGSTASQSSRVAKPEPRGECTFTAEIVDRILANRSSYESKQKIEALLSEHECEHGWGLNPSDPDYVDASHVARCSPAVLDRMAAVRIAQEDYFIAPVCKDFATSLQRAGQLDRALHLIDSAIDDLKRKPQDDLSYGADTSRLTAFATRLCEREGRTEKALEYVSREEPFTGCYNCDDSDAELIKRHRARLLIDLKRFDEARVILKAQLNEPDPCLLCAWIDCEIGSGRCLDAQRALQEIVGEDETTVKARAGGMRLYTLRHADRQTRIDGLSELATLEEDWAMPLVFSLDEKALLDRVSTFDVVGKSLRDMPLAELLAATGSPAFQAPIEHAKLALGEQMNRIEERWRDANRRWVALRQMR